MSFDLIETTVANAVLLQASFDYDPVDLNIEYDNTVIESYKIQVRATMSFKQLIKEPLGKYLFRQFLGETKAEKKLDLAKEIADFQDKKCRYRLTKSKKIFSQFLVYALKNDDILLDLNVINHLNAKVEADEMAELVIPDEDDDVISAFPEEKEEVEKEKDRFIETRLEMQNTVFLEKLDLESAEETTETIIIRDGLNELQVTEALNLSMKDIFEEEIKKFVEEEENIRFLDTEWLDLGISEAVILSVHKKWKTSISKRNIRANLFNDILVDLNKALVEVDFPRFLDSRLFDLFIKLRYYAENSAVSYKDFQIFRVLGKGAFGAVHAVRKIDTKKIYAMKEMEKRRVKFYNSERMCRLEKQALESMSSPFVLNLKYSFTNPDSLFLVMDICQGGDLQFHLSEAPNNRFSVSQTQFYAAELLLALEHIHSLGYIYRDLKPGNILLDEAGHIMLSDLGLVAKYNPKKPTTGLAGTAGYWSPEVMMRKPQSPATDWWSFGILIVRLLTGKRPKCCCTKKGAEWCPFGTSEDHPKLAKSGLPMKYSLDLASGFEHDGQKNENTENILFSEEAKDLILRLLEPDPSKRLGSNGSDEIRIHKFFQGIDWDLLANRDVTPPFVPSKGEVHAMSLAEIGDADPNLNKYRKLQLDADDDFFYNKWNYKSINGMQEEIVWTLERNRDIKRELKERNQKLMMEHRLDRGCCTLQ